MGSVGPGFEISLSTADGQPVETLTAGSYTVEVDDQSDIHNFHLTGTGVDVMTDVGTRDVESFDVTFEAGTYYVPVRPSRENDERELRSHRLEVNLHPALRRAVKRLERPRLGDRVLAAE